MKRIALYKKTGIILAAGICAVMFCGCQDSHADTPKFSTNSDRNTGFVPKTFQQKHEETENEEIKELTDEIESGINSVKEQASEISEELETELH